MLKILNSIGFRTLVKHEIKRTFAIINQVVWPPLISTLLYLLIFGYSLGSRIQSIEGVPYLSFLLPGPIMMSVIDSSFNEGAASLFVARFTNNVQELLVAPLSYTEMVLGYVAGGVLRGLIIGNLIMLLGFFVAGVFPVHFFLYLLFMLLVSAFFAAMGLAAGLMAENFDQLAIPATFVITPLIFLGGVFNSVRQLPPVLKGIVAFNPITHFIDGFRGCMLPGWPAPLMFDLGLAAIFAVGAIAFALLLFQSGYKLKG
ncbi:MAG TPA: hypothetical protein DD435_07335 [Cyanobacteria bacterium UBA8530]|nr:hypothetical protein [Cyanobacteria bacterium UBA8530]